VYIKVNGQTTKIKQHLPDWTMLHDDQMLLNETKEELQQQQLNKSYSKNIRKYGTII
jgi:hypothetical protein